MEADSEETNTMAISRQHMEADSAKEKPKVILKYQKPELISLDSQWN